MAAVDDNRFRRRHAFAPMDAAALRLTVAATRGDLSARVYEFRAFGGHGE